MRRGRIFILFALIIIFGVAAAYLLLGREQPSPEVTPTPEEGVMPSDMVLVVVAAQDISRGSTIPRDAIVIQQMPADLVVETWIAGREEQILFDQVIGRRARMDIARGVPMTTAMVTQKPGDLLGAGSDAALAIKPGYTAIAIPMTRLSGVAYALRDGDTVDVLISFTLVDLDIDFQTILPNLSTPMFSPGGTKDFPGPTMTVEIGKLEDTREAPLPPVIYGKIDTTLELEEPIHLIPQEIQRPRLVTQRLVESATVLHVGTFPLDIGEVETIAAPIEEEGLGAPTTTEEVPVQAAAPPQPDIVTLIVTPQDALAINWAMKIGADIVLTLRAPGDTTITDTLSVTLQYLIDNYNITVPAKLPYGIEPSIRGPIVPVLPNDIQPEEE